MSIVLILLYLIVVFLGFRFKKSKIIFVLSFFMAWLLIAGNYKNEDYDRYVQRYDWGMDRFVDIGFSWLCYVFSEFGVTYQGFKTIISFFSLTLIYRTFSKFSRNYTFGSAVFLVFPFIIDITQFRNFVACSVLYAAIPYLFEKSRISTIKYVALIMLAATIHGLTFFYMLFILAKFNIKVKIIFIGVIGLFFTKAALFSYYTMMYEAETGKFDDVTHSSIFGTLLNIIIIMLNAYLIYYAYKKNKRKRNQGNKDKLQRLDEIWVNVNMLLLFIIPLIIDSSNFSRLLRNIVVLNMLYLYDSRINKMRKNAIVILYILYFLFINYLGGEKFRLLVEPIFSFNSLL